MDFESAWANTLKNWILDLGSTIRFLRNKHGLEAVNAYMDLYMQRQIKRIKDELSERFLDFDPKKVPLESFVELVSRQAEYLSMTHTVIEINDNHALGYVLHCYPYDLAENEGLIRYGFPCKLWCQRFLSSLGEEFGFVAKIERTKDGCPVSIVKKEALHASSVDVFEKFKKERFEDYRR